MCHRGSGGSSAAVPSCLRRYFVDPKYFLVGISWVQCFLSWVFRRFKIFSRECFVGQMFLLVTNFMIQRFSIFGCMKRSDTKQKYINASQTVYSIPNRFQQLSVLFILERYFTYQIGYAIRQLSFVLNVFLVISFLQ